MTCVKQNSRLGKTGVGKDLWRNCRRLEKVPFLFAILIFSFTVIDVSRKVLFHEISN
ncbi:Uncharacterised protein [Klebsiella pneumoniae]|nr:Uncharacterised protein [Klebsiella pneumoniae]